MVKMKFRKETVETKKKRDRLLLANDPVFFGFYCFLPKLHFYHFTSPPENKISTLNSEAIQENLSSTLIKINIWQNYYKVPLIKLSLIRLIGISNLIQTGMNLSKNSTRRSNSFKRIQLALKLMFNSTSGAVLNKEKLYQAF